jgi:shikimate kinase
VYAKSIALVGLMGAGKTTIGQLLAKKLGTSFVDTDHLIEHRTGVTIATIFEIEGEPAFRARETSLIDELTAGSSRIVLATGGGAVLSAHNRAMLHERAIVVYLHSSAETSFERVKRARDRPLLLVTDPLVRLRQLYEVRHPLYLDACHFVVDSRGDRPSSVVADILEQLANVDGAGPQATAPAAPNVT